MMKRNLMLLLTLALACLMCACAPTGGTPQSTPGGAADATATAQAQATPTPEPALTFTLDAVGVMIEGDAVVGILECTAANGEKFELNTKGELFDNATYRYTEINGPEGFFQGVVTYEGQEYDVTLKKGEQYDYVEKDGQKLVAFSEAYFTKHVE